MALAKKPTSVIVGTSTLNFGIDPENKFIKKLNYHNFSISGIKNKLEWIKELNKQGKLENIILGLDFFEYNYHRHVEDDKEIYLLLNKIHLLKKVFKEIISIDSFMYSLKKMFNLLTENFMQNGHVSQTNYTSLKTFSVMTKSEIETLLPPPNFLFELNSNQKKSKITYLKEIINFCNQNQINLLMIIPPRHLSLTKMEKVLNINLLNDWKKDLVGLTENLIYKDINIELWDFAIPNGYTSEKIPSNDKNMEWFRDRIHFKSSLGNKVLESIFISKNQNLSTEIIGKKINQSNIDKHITMTEIKYLSYSDSLKDVFEKIEKNLLDLLPSESN